MTRPLAYSIIAIARAGLSLSACWNIFRPGPCRRPGSAEQLADLVDHLGVEGAQRDVRVGMAGCSLMAVSSAS
jgi:hypothetical protein